MEQVYSSTDTQEGRSESVCQLQNNRPHQTYRKNPANRTTQQTQAITRIHLSEEQTVFRKDRSTVHQILTLRLIAEKAKRHGKKIYNCFIDFQKAFDTIKHKVIWAVLRSYGIEEKMVTLLQKIYEKAQSAVRIGKNQEEWFHADLGTRQGDSLSPLLFIAYLERVMDHTKESNCGIRLGGTLVNDLTFADDIDLIDEDFKSLQEQLEKTRAVAEQAGLIVNVGKTKTMVLGDRKIEQEIQIGGKNVENVEKFEYLGSLITWENNCSEEIRRRIGKAEGTMASLRHVWNGKKLSRPEQTQNTDSMCLQRTPLRFRNLDPEGN